MASGLNISAPVESPTSTLMMAALAAAAKARAVIDWKNISTRGDKEKTKALLLEGER